MVASKALPASSFPATPLLNEFTARVQGAGYAGPCSRRPARPGVEAPSPVGARRGAISDQGIGLALHAAWTEMCSCIPRRRKAGGRSTPPWPCTSTTRA